ncbi:MAG: hypothetical protein WAW37_17825 [Syntrophobacteraceae bacterium]
MSFEQIRDAVMSLDESDRKRFIVEVAPEIWRGACRDDACAMKLKELVDADIARPYEDMHLWGI